MKTTLGTLAVAALCVLGLTYLIAGAGVKGSGRLAGGGQGTGGPSIGDGTGNSRVAGGGGCPQGQIAGDGGGNSGTV